jgi:hypothetical protein
VQVEQVKRIEELEKKVLIIPSLQERLKELTETVELLQNLNKAKESKREDSQQQQLQNRVQELEEKLSVLQSVKDSSVSASIPLPPADSKLPSTPKRKEQEEDKQSGRESSKRQRRSNSTPAQIKPVTFAEEKASAKKRTREDSPPQPLTSNTQATATVVSALSPLKRAKTTDDIQDNKIATPLFNGRRLGYLALLRAYDGCTTPVTRKNVDALSRCVVAEQRANKTKDPAQEAAARAELIKVKQIIANDPKLCGHAIAAQEMKDEGFVRPSKLEIRDRAGPIVRRMQAERERAKQQEQERARKPVRAIQAELLGAAPAVGSVVPVVVASTNTEVNLNVATASGVSVPTVAVV